MNNCSLYYYYYLKQNKNEKILIYMEKWKKKQKNSSNFESNFFYKHKHFGSYLMRWPNSSTCFYYRCYLSPSTPKNQHTHTHLHTNTFSLLSSPPTKNESHPIHFQSCSFSVYINTWPLYTLEKFLVLPLEWITILDLLYSSTLSLLFTLSPHLTYYIYWILSSI